MTPSFEGNLEDIMEDIDLGNFREVTALLGPAIDRTVQRVFDPYNPIDPSDGEESVGNLLGMILVAAQVCMASIAGKHGLKKKIALGLGPKHPCGDTKARLLNHLANLWKHADEWDPTNLTSQQVETLTGVGKVGIPDVAFFEAFQSALETDILDYSALEQVLKDWRKAVDEHKAEA